MSLPPHLAPWSHAGVGCLLVSAPLPPELGLLALANSPAGAALAGLPAHAPGEAAAVSDRQTAQERTASRPATGRPAQPKPAQPPAGVSGASATPAPQRSASSRLPAFIPPEHWPPLWQERLRITGKAPVLWTYLELGEDLYGTPNPQRRALFARLIRDLGHRSGTHSFWPCALPAQPVSGGQAVLVPDASLFWSGVRELGARVLLVFGEAAFAAMGIAPLPPLRQVRQQGLLIMALPPAEELVANQGRYAPMLSFVRTALQRFTRNTDPEWRRVETDGPASVPC